MNKLIIDALRAAWADQPDLRARVLSWQWFETETQQALEQAASTQALSIRVDTEVLCRAFFDWARAVELHQHLDARDPVDFRHAMAGLLLQHLFAANGAVRGRPLLRTHPIGGASDPAVAQDGAGLLFTSVVLTLLQALRQQTGAPPFTPDTGLPHYWNSYLENAAQDPATAICFLDRMTGLEPVWQAPTAIASRPAMLEAAAGLTVSS